MYTSGHTSGEKSHVVFLLKYLLTCDHFVKVCIKGLKGHSSKIWNLNLQCLSMLFCSQVDKETIASRKKKRKKILQTSNVSYEKQELLLAKKLKCLWKGSTH